MIYTEGIVQPNVHWVKNAKHVIYTQENETLLLNLLMYAHNHRKNFATYYELWLVEEINCTNPLSRISA